MTLKEKVIEYWQSFNNSTLNNLLVNIDHLEKNVYKDCDQYDEKVLEIINKYTSANFNEENGEIFVRMLNEFPLAYMSYMVHYVHSKNSEYFSNLFSFLERNINDYHIKFFMERNRAFERAQILARIFTQDRMNDINKALEDIL